MTYRQVLSPRKRFVPTVTPVQHLTNNFRGGSDGITVSTANSGGTSGDAFSAVGIAGAGNTIVFSGDFPHGTGLGVQFAASAAAGGTYVEWGDTVVETIEGFARHYGYWPDAPPANIEHLSFLTSSAGRIATVRANTDRTLSLLNAAGSVVGTTTTALPLDELHRIEVRVVVGLLAGQIELRLFTGADAEDYVTTPTETLLVTGQNTGATPIGRCRLGWFDHGSVTYAMYADDFGFSTDTWLGPCASFIFETFDTADSDVLGPIQSWTETQGDTDIVSNEARSSSAVARCRAERALDHKDMFVQARVTASDDVDQGRLNVAARMSLGTNAELSMYIWQIDFANNTTRFFRTIGGGSTQIGGGVSVALTGGTYYVMRLEVVGQVLTGYVDGTPLISFTDSAPPRNFVPGLRAGFALQKTNGGYSAADDWSAGTHVDKSLPMPRRDQRVLVAL